MKSPFKVYIMLLVSPLVMMRRKGSWLIDSPLLSVPCLVASIAYITASFGSVVGIALGSTMSVNIGKVFELGHNNESWHQVLLAKKQLQSQSLGDFGTK